MGLTEVKLEVGLGSGGLGNFWAQSGLKCLDWFWFIIYGPDLVFVNTRTFFAILGKLRV